ncbi:MAG: hypothetical protein K1X90_06790 [Candidatus Kapabacteria bacterium]|nr:hypothetical protein [Candidatus Kapabacteria bacterium]
MNTDIWVDRLYADPSLTDNLQDNDAERLLSWTESQLMECDSDGTARQLIESIRLLNRYVGQGRPFDELFLALKANTTELHPATMSEPLQSADPNLTEQYPIAGGTPSEPIEITGEDGPASEQPAGQSNSSNASNPTGGSSAAADFITPTDQ